MSAEDVKPPPDREWERTHGQHIEEHKHYHTGSGAHARLNTIILGVASFALAALWGIAVWMIQDLRSEVREGRNDIKALDKRVVVIETRMEAK